jgi:hypothetical protein
MEQGQGQEIHIFKTLRRLKVKASTVRGTPVRSISADNGQGFTSGGKPANYSGTVPNAYQGDQSQKINPKSGTPYNSSSVNDDKAAKSTTGKYGHVIDEVAGDQGSHLSNGNGVILDGLSRESDYTPRAAGTMDSPVPNGAASFPAGAMRTENIAHLGKGVGVDASQAGDVLEAIGGVMSRGMEEGSKS